MVLFPEGLKALKKVAKEVGLDLRGASLNLDGGFDSARKRKGIFNAGLIPNIKENPRNRKHPKRGRKRLFNAAIHALRLHIERTFAVGGQIQTAVAPIRTYSAAAPWYEVAGVHVDHSASVLRSLKLATSYQRARLETLHLPCARQLSTLPPASEPPRDFDTDWSEPPRCW